MGTIINRINDAFDSFRKLNIVILGDVMLDRFIKGTVERISPEAPVPVMLKEGEESFPGGAANVAMNVVELGGMTHLIGVVGADRAGEDLLKLLEENRVDKSGVMSLPLARTTVKTRYVSMGHQLLRVDEEVYLKELELDSEMFPNLPSNCDGLLVSDYNKGVIPLFAKRIIKQAAERCIPIIVDPKPPNWSFYAGCTVVTPNRKESLSALSDGDLMNRSIENIAKSVQLKAQAENTILTWGAEGLYTWNGEILEHIKSHRVSVFDSTGAGDSFVAALALSLISGLDLLVSAKVANAAGAVAVSTPGIARVNCQNILRILSNEG